MSAAPPPPRPPPGCCAAMSRSRPPSSRRRSPSPARIPRENMATNIVVPALGESVTEATVAKWTKAVGDPVQRDETLAELETDKVTLEVYASANGRLSEIRAPAGATVEVGAVLGVIEAADGAPIGAGAAAPAPAAAPAQPAEPAAPATPAPSPAPVAAPAPGAVMAPSVRKIVAESGLDIA